MRKSRQPLALRDLAMNVLVEFYASFCSRCKSEESLDKLRECISYMREHVCPLIPWRLAVGFHERFFKRIPSFDDVGLDSTAVKYRRAVLEILMDRKIIGLRCSSEMLFGLDVRDAHRIEEIKELEYQPDRMGGSFEYFQLQYLTILQIDGYCTDEDLKIVAKNCPKLEVLRVSRAQKLSDEGLTFLNSCADLAQLDISDCFKISSRGIEKFLSVNKKIRKLKAHRFKKPAYGYDCFRDRDMTVHPSITHFHVPDVNPGLSIEDDHLNTIVTKFPNLTSLFVENVWLEADLCILKNLPKLSDIKLEFWCVSSNRDNVEQLLLSVGHGIRKLQLYSTSWVGDYLWQKTVDFIFEFCPNIESFAFEYIPRFDGDTLIVPPFKELTSLTCSCYKHDSNDSSVDFLNAVIKFESMVNLEELRIIDFSVAAETVESLILDHSSFPNLKMLSVNQYFPKQDKFRLIRLAEDNNVRLILN